MPSFVQSPFILVFIQTADGNILDFVEQGFVEYAGTCLVSEIHTDREPFVVERSPDHSFDFGPGISTDHFVVIRKVVGVIALFVVE